MGRLYYKVLFHAMVVVSSLVLLLLLVGSIFALFEFLFGAVT